jgi:predicted CXXCH cytochrome family protein
MQKTSLLFTLLPVMITFFTFIQPNEPVNRESVMIKTGFQRQAEDPKCTDCHSDLIEKKTVHTPAAESCENCHQVSIKEHSENGTKGLMLTEKVPGLCFMCHDGIKSYLDTIKNIHPAITNNKSCTYCHSPHSSSEKKLLMSEEKKLCLSCHNKDVLANGKKTVNMDKLLTSSKVIHPAIENDGCVVCHQPHGSPNSFLLKSSFPVGNYNPPKSEIYAACWECHDSELLTSKTTTTATNFRNGNINLHFLHTYEKNGRSCTMCHNVHASQNNHLIENKVKFGEWELPLRYTPRENGGSCFPGCHAEKTYNR